MTDIGTWGLVGLLVSAFFAGQLTVLFTVAFMQSRDELVPRIDALVTLLEAQQQVTTLTATSNYTATVGTPTDAEIKKAVG